MSAMAVTLFPDPDSPRMASVSPGARSKLTPLTARTTPSGVGNSTCRSRTARSAASTGSASGERSSATDTTGLTETGVEGIAERISHEDEGQHRQAEEQAGEQQQVGRLQHTVL